MKQWLYRYTIVIEQVELGIFYSLRIHVRQRTYCYF